MFISLKKEITLMFDLGFSFLQSIGQRDITAKLLCQTLVSCLLSLDLANF